MFSYDNNNNDNDNNSDDNDIIITTTIRNFNASMIAELTTY